MPLAVWALVIGAFAMGADEFIVAGVVQEIATALGVTIGDVGHLESVYALGVAIGAPVFAALGTRFGRRSMLLATTAVFLAGNPVSRSAPTMPRSCPAGSCRPPPTARSWASRRSSPRSWSTRRARAEP